VPQKPMSMEKELSRQKPFIFLHNHLLLLFSFFISDWPDLSLDIQDGCQAEMHGSLVHPQRGYAT
jgi:hypothetical protein